MAYKKIKLDENIEAFVIGNKGVKDPKAYEYFYVLLSEDKPQFIPNIFQIDKNNNLVDRPQVKWLSHLEIMNQIARYKKINAKYLIFGVQKDIKNKKKRIKYFKDTCKIYIHTKVNKENNSALGTVYQLKLPHFLVNSRFTAPILYGTTKNNSNLNVIKYYLIAKLEGRIYFANDCTEKRLGDFEQAQLYTVESMRDYLLDYSKIDDIEFVAFGIPIVDQISFERFQEFYPNFESLVPSKSLLKKDDESTSQLDILAEKSVTNPSCEFYRLIRTTSKFILGYKEEGKTYLYSPKGQVIELFNVKQLDELSKLVGVVAKKDIDGITQSLADKKDFFAIEVDERVWSDRDRLSFITDNHLLKLWYPRLNHIGYFPLTVNDYKKINYFGKGEGNKVLVGYIDCDRGKVRYCKEKLTETTVSIKEARPFSFKNILPILEVSEKFRNRKYFLLDYIKSSQSQFGKKGYKDKEFENFVKKYAKNPVIPVTKVALPNGMFRYAYRSDIRSDLKSISVQNDYQKYRNFQPFLRTYSGEALAIPCQIKNRKQGNMIYIYGWYVNDEGVVKIRWFPNYREAMNRRSSGIYIDIKTQKLFFSGQVFDKSSRDPVFLENIFFEGKKIGNQMSRFEASFANFWNKVHQLRRENLIERREAYNNRRQ